MFVLFVCLSVYIYAIERESERTKRRLCLRDIYIMIQLLKSLSRTVHDEEEEVKHIEKEEYNWDKQEEDNGEWKTLTVWRKSLCVGCNGFTVINSDGNLVYRVDNYPGHLHQILLMDALGNPVLTISRRKQKLGLTENWLMYEGEDGDCNTSTTKSLNQPICCARKHINILQPNAKIIARVYGGKSSTSCRYVIEGSYWHRSCKVLDHESRKVVAEIRKKEATMEGVCFGLDVFVLIVRPGFSPRFAMGIVLLLDQMFS